MIVPEPLLPLFDDGLIEEVIRPLMSGKEASVYLVRSQGQICVAKIYKDANNRSFRQRAAYAEGRTVRNSRKQRAMAKGSRYGKALLEAEWQNAEVGALYRLHEAGVRVPIPMHFGDNVLVMELITDGEGNPAPRLWDVRLARDEAIELHRHLVRQVVLILCAGLVHGDLSEYNILLSGDGPVIIDLPQTTDAAHNRNSERIFLRDVRNLRNYFGRFAPQLRKTRYGPEIWDLYNQGKLHPESPLTGKFKRSSQRADTAGIIAEIQASAEEAGERPMSAYQLKRQKKIEAALAEAERSAAEAEKRALQRAARQQDGPDRKGGRPPRGKDERPPRGKGDRPRPRRRRRRRGGGRGS